MLIKHIKSYFILCEIKNTKGFKITKIIYIDFYIQRVNRQLFLLINLISTLCYKFCYVVNEWEVNYYNFLKLCALNNIDSWLLTQI